MRTYLIKLAFMKLVIGLFAYADSSASMAVAASSSQPAEFARHSALWSRPAWPLPPKDLPTFGAPTADSIKIAIYGAPGCVIRPGYYFLPQQAGLSEAIAAAQGLDGFAAWNSFPGIQREAATDSWEIVTEGRDADSSVPLQNGDMIYVGFSPPKESPTPRFQEPPDGLQTFGEQVANTVKIAIYGEPGCIKKPGYYFLPQQPTVSKVIEAAQGLGRHAIWSSQSGIQRHKTNGTWELVQFSIQLRDIQPSFVLRDGDMIFIGAHQYTMANSAHWHRPSTNLPIYGERTTNSIRVAVHGMAAAMIKPGFHFLPRGSHAVDLIKIAGSRLLDPSYSGLQRVEADGRWMIIPFRSGRRQYEHEADWKLIPLEEGDEIYCGHEIY
jgi:protein involved in polysaccharide export with SLBB domain